jgi:chemotaxis signal transduction protein
MSLVDDLLPHMRRVLAADRDLHDLSLLWQMIEASSAISCPEQAESILPTLSQTRERFADLQQRLVRQLGHEHLAELGEELASIAQCTIDILVRNLFERTADVGFLATDDVLRRHCLLAADEQRAHRAAVERRLAEYRDKYTVYDDVVVLGVDGQVLARLDAGGKLHQTGDAIIAQSLAAAGYVERYGPTDLSADGGEALLYGHRIDDGHGRALGVLVLRFRCIDELQRIFSSVGDSRKHLAISLLDGDRRVLVSNDPSHVPPGARLDTAADGEVAITVFGGREYLSVTCATRGYQGYGGPGWRAQAMVSLLTAFRGSAASGESQPQVSLDNEALRQIQLDVDGINRNLRRVVWNGRLMAGLREGSQAQLKAVLAQVNAAGARTRDRVAAAIGDLYQTALGRAGHQARELARLAADIMDRNLYERANDCRWWALSPVVRRVLAASPEAAADRALQDVLTHINGLYTVYTRLVAFDASGRVRAVSNEDEQAPLVGTQIDDAWLRATLALSDSQRYAVSEFVASPLNAGVPTYVYLAAVRNPAGDRVVGGMAIVFNAEREFHAMLTDVLDDRAGIAIFVDGDGRVVASTDPGHRIGQALAFDTRKGIVEHDGAHLAVACTRASGYREFKCEDGYQNGISAVVALRLGAVERRTEALHDQSLRAQPMADRRQTMELAMFQVGGVRYALPLQAVLDARETVGLLRAPGARGACVGLLEVPAQRGSVVVPVLCARRLLGVNHEPRAGDGVVLVHPAAPGRAQPMFGLRVDDVTTVLEVGLEHLQDAPGHAMSAGDLIGRLARVSNGPDERDALIQVLDFDALLRAAGLTPHTELHAA